MGDNLISKKLAGKNFFLTPVCLVPNGRAHLGHIAGPLLKMDILRRHIERAGGQALVISVSDSHESHVPVRAHQEGVEPADVANLNHYLIARDLAALDIRYDDLLNPLDDEWSSTYEKVNRDFLRDIVDGGNAEVRTEPMPVLATESASPHSRSLRPRVGEPVVSGWLKGRCPLCGQPLVGFFCESCGGHFSPSQMIDPGTAHFDGEMVFEDIRSLYLKVPGGPDRLAERLSDMRVRPDFRAIAEKYMEANGASVRLTVPSPWGIGWDEDDVSPGQVIFSYSALLIGCHLVAGERYRQLTGDRVNPFDATSDVHTVISFGIDNAVPFMVGAVGCGMAQDRYKPVDSLLVNYFYDLEGSKFSTSRGHVIWGGDIVTLAGAEPDLVRAYLSYQNPEFGRAGFRAEEFLQFHNEVGARIGTAAERAAQAAGTAARPDREVLGFLDAALNAQHDALTLDTFDLRAAWEQTDLWIRRAPSFASTPAAAAAWLLGFALLSGPIMPATARRVWERIGLEGAPSLAVLDGDPEVRPGDLRTPWLAPITRHQLNACLPSAIRF